MPDVTLGETPGTSFCDSVDKGAHGGHRGGGNGRNLSGAGIPLAHSPGTGLPWPNPLSRHGSVGKYWGGIDGCSVTESSLIFTWYERLNVESSDGIRFA